MSFPNLIRFGHSGVPGQWRIPTGVDELDHRIRPEYLGPPSADQYLGNPGYLDPMPGPGSFSSNTTPGGSLYDLPSAMAIGEAPKPFAPSYDAPSPLSDPAVAAFTGQRPDALGLVPPIPAPTPAPPRAPVSPFSITPTNFLNEPAVMQPAPGMVDLAVPKAGTPDLPIPAAAPAPSSDTRWKRTFTNGVLGGGDVSYDMLTGANGDVRYAGTGTSQDNLPFAFDAGQPDFKDQAARVNSILTELAKNQALQDPKTQGALALEELRGKYNVQEAEARRHDVINSKLMEAALFNQQRTFEATGDEAAARDAFNRTMRIAAASLPGSVVAGAGGLPGAMVGAEAPLSPTAIGDRSIGEELAGLVRGAEYNTGSAKAMLEAISRIKDPQARKAAIATAIGRNRGVDQLGDQVALAAANDFLIANPENYTNFAPDQTGLPIEMLLDTPSFLGIRTKTPQLRVGSRTIDFPRSARPGQGFNTIASNTTLRDAVARRAAAAEFLNALIGAGYGK